MKKISLVITTLNEEQTIIPLLESIGGQKLVPDEVVIVDGGSIDRTVILIKKFETEFLRSANIKTRVFVKRGNRSIGRNYAIKKAKNSWIAVTDAGCTLDKNWLKELSENQDKLGTEVVAGYYSANPKTSFEEAVVPYVLVMQDKVDKNNFLPATRSVLFSKNTWNKLGGFNEDLSDNEDYDFAKRLQLSGIKIGFARKAIVNWTPSSTLKSFNKMIFRFARGDVYAGIIRPKVLLIFLRYAIGFSVFLWGVFQLKVVGNVWILFGLVPTIIASYILWSIYKNYHYLQRGTHWLPVLQLSSDIAVMWGSVCGFIKKIL